MTAATSDLSVFGLDSGGALIWSPFADEASAASIADQLLDEHLVACANILPAMRSIFRWNGERGETQECGALFKTSAALLESATKRLEEIHPYDAPVILGWPVGAASAATIAWLTMAGGTKDTRA